MKGKAKKKLWPAPDGRWFVERNVEERRRKAQMKRRECKGKRNMYLFKYTSIWSGVRAALLVLGIRKPDVDLLTAELGQILRRTSLGLVGLLNGLVS